MLRLIRMSWSGVVAQAIEAGAVLVVVDLATGVTLGQDPPRALAARQAGARPATPAPAHEHEADDEGDRGDPDQREEEKPPVLGSVGACEKDVGHGASPLRQMLGSEINL